MFMKSVALGAAIALVSGGAFGQSNPDCALCELVTTAVETAIAAGITDAAGLEKVLTDTCNNLPGSLRGECNNFVALYGALVIELELQGDNPNQTCVAIGVCDS